MAEDGVLRATDVRVEYRTPGGTVTAVGGVSVTVPPSGVTVLAGPSGSGKSTMLRVLSLVERPTSGSVVLHGRETAGLSSRRRRRLRRTEIALVFQNPSDNLISHLSVGENLRAAAQAAGQPDRTEELLTRFGLPDVVRWRTPALSGGQQQRLAFACALARGASVVLADEPTSQLDARSADLVLETVSDLAGRGVPVVVASHDPRLVGLGTTVLSLRDGTVIA
ncbi:ATP-binding cassette domain-containing protein [Umezawaea beigongshangensis]|uniref:ATP-binding cassette domain-containing protein n=1 Tax=Umezawaea beigongshangensis TaxID=2780383 RepID=UPI0018F198CE|nr:ATP-binding cassette domain-containing protein [Umezawaea beigongshangensis]